jgi:hypothetical protein
VIRKVIEYVQGWMVTRDIKRNNPELWAFLCSDESRDPANYVERQRPS